MNRMLDTVNPHWNYWDLWRAENRLITCPLFFVQDKKKRKKGTNPWGLRVIFISSEFVSEFVFAITSSESAAPLYPALLYWLLLPPSSVTDSWGQLKQRMVPFMCRTLGQEQRLWTRGSYSLRDGNKRAPFPWMESSFWILSHACSLPAPLCTCPDVCFEPKCLKAELWAAGRSHAVASVAGILSHPVAVIWWSSQLQLALPVGSNLRVPAWHWVVRKEKCPCSTPPFPPKRSEAATAVPLLFSLFFLHLCHSLGAMQIHSPYPPISILRVFSLVWMGLCSGVGRIREGWMNGNAFLCVADQCAVVFSAFLIRQLLKLFNPRARPL